MNSRRKKKAVHARQVTRMGLRLRVIVFRTVLSTIVELIVGAIYRSIDDRELVTYD